MTLPHTEAASAPTLFRLQREWQRITMRMDELDEVRLWGLPGMPVATLDNLLDRCGFDPGACEGTTETADLLLLRLVELAHDRALAARIVLQRILPPLCAVARRNSTTRDQRHELMDELVANAWTVIRNYPVARRRSHVAANLVRDVAFETIVRPVRRRSAHEVPTQLELLDDCAAEVAVEPLDELVDVLRSGRRGQRVSEGDIAFVCQLVNHVRLDQLAVALDVTPRTIRNHRDAVVHRLRALVSEPAA